MSHTRITQSLPKFSHQTINALITMLLEFDAATRKILSHKGLFYIRRTKDHNFRATTQLFELGRNCAANLPAECLTSLNKFLQHKSELPEADRARLRNAQIKITTQVGNTQVKKFADIFFNVFPEKDLDEDLCLFTSQIFLWQLVVNEKPDAIRQVPLTVQHMARLLMFSLGPVVQQMNGDSDISYHEQLKAQRKPPEAYELTHTPYQGNFLLFAAAGSQPPAQEQVVQSRTRRLSSVGVN